MIGRYYRTVQDSLSGRWMVVHDLPGLSAVAIDCDCLTQGAAELEAGYLNAARRARLAQEADERQLLGQRRFAA